MPEKHKDLWISDTLDTGRGKAEVIYVPVDKKEDLERLLQHGSWLITQVTKLNRTLNILDDAAPLFLQYQIMKDMAEHIKKCYNGKSFRKYTIIFELEVGNFGGSAVKAFELFVKQKNIVYIGGGWHKWVANE